MLFIINVLLSGIGILALMYSLYSMGLATIAIFTKRYETPELLEEYKKIQYGPFFDKAVFHSEAFYQKILTESKPYLSGKTSLLDIGCGIGRMVFEFEKLQIADCTGIDSSRSFIRYCRKIQNHQVKNLTYRSKVNSTALFIQGDIITFSFGEEEFDIIICLNVIDRVACPTTLIKKMYNLLSHRGIAIVSTPYDWELSPAKRSDRINSIADLFTRDMWNTEKILNIPYVVKTNAREIIYQCDIGIFQKR